MVCLLTMSTNLYKLSKYVLVCCLACLRKKFLLPNEGEEQVKNVSNVGESNVGESNNILVNEGDDSTQVETGSSFQTEDNIIGKRRTSVV